MAVKVLFACACGLAACVAGAADLKMLAQPAFSNYGGGSGVTPLAVTLRNDGSDASGTLHVGAYGFEMDYPIELPHGTVKRLITYPCTRYAEEIQLDLSTNRGDVHSTYRHTVFSDPSAQNILLIGDNEGELGFVRREQSSGAGQMVDCYVKPEAAPDRPIAYSRMSAIVLGPGAERLSDSAVRALRLYVVSGGTVVFLGGASPAVLGDRRWAGFLPAATGLPKTIDRATTFDGFATDRVGSFTAIDCRLVPGATARRDGSRVISARLDVGLGKTVLLTFNLLEPPFTRWTGRRAMFSKLVRPTDSQRSAAYLASFDHSSYAAEDSPFSYGYAGRPGFDVQGRGDPFSTTLPKPEKVFWILASYFVVIIPVNFLLLKKLKRGELAWFTAPVISVAFAGAFFAAAKDLYSAKLSTATEGLLVVAKGGDEAVFVGHSQMFFPQGGRYDLKMVGLDSVGQSDSYDDYYGYRNSSKAEGVNPIDMGQVLVPHMEVNNLAFRDLGYRQIPEKSQWIQTTLTRSASGAVLNLTNVGARPIEQVTAVVAGRAFPVGNLRIGQTQKVELPPTIEADPVKPANVSQPPYGSYNQGPMPLTGVTELTFQTKEIVVKASVPDAPFGPRIGQVVRSRQNIMLVYFTGLHYGKEQL